VLYAADLRPRAAGGQHPDPGAVAPAEERMQAFDERHCPGGADGS
jgi:hypothetical protein